MTKPYVHPATVIVLAGVAAASHIGKLPPALPVLQHALSISLVQGGFLLSMMQIGGMALGLAVGLSADSLGLRRCMLIGLALLALASALGGTANDVVGLLVSRALEGLGFLLVVMPAPALIRLSVVPSQLATRLGWWGSYMPLGSAGALLLGPIVMARVDWSVWWWMLAGITFIAGLAVWWWVPVQVTAAPVLPTTPVQTPWTQRLYLTLTRAGPWLVSLSFAAYSSQWIAVIGFLPTVYGQAGLPPSLTGLLTACVALVNVSGNVAAARLLHQKWPAHRVLQLGFACMSLGALGAFGQWHGQVLGFGERFACVLMFSAVGGLIPATLFSLALQLAPNQSTVSTTVGYMQQWSSTGQFAGPPLVAWVAASVGGWQWTWTVTGALCATGAILAQVIGQVLKKKAHLALS